MSGGERPQPGTEVITYQVGYAKPPARSQFKKGQSGNPRGRPKGSVSRRKRGKGLKYELSPEVLRDTFLEEAYRMVSLNTAQGEEEISIARAVIRALGVKAAKGHIHAQRLFAQTLFEIEAKNRAQSEDYMEGIVEYKTNWTSELQRRAAMGLPLDPPVPHPDDVILDMRLGTVEVIGPLSKNEKAKLDNYKALLEEYRETEARYEATLKEPLACEEEQSHRDWMEQQLKRNRVLITMLEALTGEREMLSQRELRKLAAEARE